MNVRRSFLCLAVAAAVPLVTARATDDPPQAPCTPVEAEGDGSAAPSPRISATLYSHGDPSDEEQFLLELMNRARLHPADEGQRIFDDYGDANVKSAVNYYVQQRPGVEYTRSENRTAFQGYAARPPLAFNAKLGAAATAHTTAMVDAAQQSHQLPGEKSLGDRIRDESYSFLLVGESVYAYAKNMVHAHAGFAIDWGQSVPGGETRPQLGHRDSLMNFSGTRDYVECGISVQNESKPSTDVGPKVLTIDFGRPADAGVRFVTGVCYQDRDGDGEYDMGEGLAGVQIQSAATNFYTVSSASGGYSLPVPANAGLITVTATGEVGAASEPIGVQNVQVTMQGSNEKLDFTQPADPPRPVAQTFASAAAIPLAGDGAATGGMISVPAFDTEHDRIGDLDLAVAFSHPDASRFAIDLTSPSGTKVRVWDHGLSIANLAGEFDTTLVPAASLSAFVGETFAGDWTLDVTDDAPAGAASVTSWSLTIRPNWVRPLQGSRSNLGITTFKATDKPVPSGDSLKIQGVVDTGGRELATTGPVRLRLLRPDGTEISRHDASLAGQSKITQVAGTSKATFRISLKGFDFAEALPSPLGVEITLGGAVVRQSIALRAGAATSAAAPLSPYLRVDTLKSAIPAGGTRTTTVTGRFAPEGSSIDDGVEVEVGDQSVFVPLSAFTSKGTRRTANLPGVIRRVVVDTKTGAFTVRIQGAHQPLVGGIVPVSLRLGAIYGDTAVKPSGTTTLKY